MRRILNISPEYAKVVLLAASVLAALAYDASRAQISQVAQRCFELCWYGPGVSILRDCEPFDFDGDKQITLFDWMIWSEDGHCAHSDLERCPR